MRRAADSSGRRRRPRPALGQHFLGDPRIIRRIADALDPDPADVALEIGPGTGDLTRSVAPRVSRVVAIERDPRLAAQCAAQNAESGLENVTLVQGDALAIDWPGLIPPSAIRARHWKIIGNIPYYITTPLLEKALLPPVPERVVFLVQAEVGERIVAVPGTKAYGALSVGIQIASRVERLFRVKAGAFRPAPQVDSVLIRLWPSVDPPFDAAALVAFRRFVAEVFSRRRKQLHNVVRSVLGWAPERVAATLGQLGIDPAWRPEVLSPEDFVRLWRETLRGRG